MTNEASPWRPEFLEALRLLARASDALHTRGLPRPVLVGGGAVEIYTGNAVMTGDIDVVSPVQPELEEELLRLGFQRPSGAGQSLRGLIHPALALGFEVIGSIPMDGASDPARLRRAAGRRDGLVPRVGDRGHDRRPHGPVRQRQRARDAQAGANPASLVGRPRQGLS